MKYYSLGWAIKKNDELFIIFLEIFKTENKVFNIQNMLIKYNILNVQSL